MSRTIVKWRSYGDIIAVKETGEVLVYPVIHDTPRKPYSAATMGRVGWIRVCALECALLYGVS